MSSKSILSFAFEILSVVAVIAGLAAGYAVYVLYTWTVDFSNYDFSGEAAITTILVVAYLIVLGMADGILYGEISRVAGSFVSLVWLPYAIRYIVERVS